MKKVLILLSLLLVLPLNVFAVEGAVVNPLNCEEQEDGSNKCQLHFQASNVSGQNQVKFTLTLKNVTITSFDYSDNWTGSNEGNNYVAEIKESQFREGDNVIATFVYKKIEGKTECSVECEMSFSSISNSCRKADDVYFDKQGNVTDEDGYKTSCETTPTPSKPVEETPETPEQTTPAPTPVEENPKCEVKDGKYFDDNGNSVSKEEYDKACPHICTERDGKYFDKNGNEVSKEAYFTSCGVVENPKTGLNLPITIILGLSFISLVTLYLTKNKSKLYNLK